jgi:Tol biopolymer transport system component/DNA-binding winged helix-turn-helix (wHTH) protein
MPRISEPSSLQVPSERLRVGDCIVDVPLREVRAPSARRPQRITPKSMGVLLVLVENAGKVVSRDALLAEVWPDTLPTDDVITQAITQLRKAFGQERGDPRYIETIAKNGYRLLAPVEWLSPTAGATAPGHAASLPAVGADDGIEVVPWPVTPRRSHSELIVASLLVLLLMGLVLLFAWWRGGESGRTTIQRDAWLQQSPPATRPYRLITSAPGFELAPTLSPDASMVAYVAVPDGQRSTAILVQTTDQSQPRQLTRPPGEAEDSAPAWSPDGREIAYVRMIPGEECAVMVVAASGGADRKVADCDRRIAPTFSWTPDGRSLIFGSMVTESGSTGLRILDLASGSWRAVPYRSGADDVDLSPRYSPDGRWIVFVRNGPLGDFWRLPAHGGEAQRLSDLRADVRGWDWLPNGDGLLFGRMIDGIVRLYQLDFHEGLVSDLGFEGVWTPTVALTRPAAAFVQRKPYYGLYRIALPDPRQPGVHVAEPIFPSSARDISPMASPDGRQLAFFSDRSGVQALWWADLAKPDSLRMIPDVQPRPRYAPVWSPDSRRLLVTGVEPSGQAAVYEVTPARGHALRLPVPVREPAEAVYLPDPNRLLVVAGVRDGRLQAELYDRRAKPWRRLARLDDVSHVQLDAAGRRLLFSRQTRAGLWQVDLDLNPASVRQVDDDGPASDRYRLWSVAADGRVVYLEQLQGCAARLRRLGQASPPPPSCLDQTRRSAPTGFSLAPRDVIYVSLAEWDGADIGFMELPSESKEHVPGWAR